MKISIRSIAIRCDVFDVISKTELNTSSMNIIYEPHPSSLCRLILVLPPR
jgi:hypothetical protein